MVVYLDDEKSGQQKKAQEILRTLKKSWGFTWGQMAQFIPYPETTLRVYASYGDTVPAMPEQMIGILLSMADAPRPELDTTLSGDRAVTIYKDEAHLIDPDIRVCRYCGRVFAARHPQQEYCTGYRGECGLAMRRKRYKWTRIGEILDIPKKGEG